MKPPLTTSIAIAALSVLLVAASPARSQGPALPKPGMPASFTVISPIYGQLVRFSMPSAFVAAAENVNGGSKRRVGKGALCAVPTNLALHARLTVEQWRCLRDSAG
jgi:hypothetical protein